MKTIMFGITGTGKLYFCDVIYEYQIWGSNGDDYGAYVVWLQNNRA